MAALRCGGPEAHYLSQTCVMRNSTASEEENMSTDSNALFQPFTLGGLTLPNRLVMAP